MKQNFLKILGLLLFVLTATPHSLTAQAPDPATAAIAGSPQFQIFLENLRGAINTQDVVKLKTCFHPKSLPIVEADKNSSAKFAKRFANPIPGECNVAIKPISPTAPLPFADKGVVFPVRPSHQIQISFNAANGQPTALVIFAIQEKGKWYEVVPAAPPGK